MALGLGGYNTDHLPDTAKLLLKFGTYIQLSVLAMDHAIWSVYNISMI